MTLSVKVRQKVEKELLFKVTEKGFERMVQQEVKALPQKVVIGTNSETLDAKNFVQVKDGEVIGFVENQIQQKSVNKSKSRNERSFWK